MSERSKVHPAHQQCLGIVTYSAVRHQPLASRRAKISPGAMGSQKVKKRKSNVAARPAAMGTAMRLSVATETASKTPSPPGHHSKRPRQRREHEAGKDWRRIDLEIESHQHHP